MLQQDIIYFLRLTHSQSRIDNTKDIFSISAIINNIVQKIQYIVRSSIRYRPSSDQIFKIKI